MMMMMMMMQWCHCLCGHNLWLSCCCCGPTPLQLWKSTFLHHPSHVLCVCVCLCLCVSVCVCPTQSPMVSCLTPSSMTAQESQLVSCFWRNSVLFFSCQIEASSLLNHHCSKLVIQNWLLVIGRSLRLIYLFSSMQPNPRAEVFGQWSQTSSDGSGSSRDLIPWKLFTLAEGFMSSRIRNKSDSDAVIISYLLYRQL